MSAALTPRHALRLTGGSTASLSSTRCANALRSGQCPTCTPMPTMAIGSSGSSGPAALTVSADGVPREGVGEAAGEAAGDVAGARGLLLTAADSSPSHSSISRCALIPPNPKPFTAARRGTSAPRRCHGWLCCRIVNGLSARRTLSEGRSKLATGGSVPCCIASSVLMRPALPAAVSRWPMFDLTALSTHWPLRQSPPCHRRDKLANSTASPTGVPVAWHSIKSTMSGVQPACA